MSWPRKVPGHPQTTCWSPNLILFYQGFNIHMYSDKHTRSCFMHIVLILTVPVEVLALGPVSIYRLSYLRMAISMLKIRRPLGRLIFNMGIAIPGKAVFLIETAPCEMQGHPWTQCWSPNWILFYIACNVISIWSSLYPWMSWPRKMPHIWCWSPNWILFCQGFSIHAYSDKHSHSCFRNPHWACGFHINSVKHCISCFMQMTLVFAVPGEVWSEIC